MSFAIAISSSTFTYNDVISITGNPTFVHIFDTVGFRSRGGTEPPWTQNDAGTSTFHNDLTLTNPGVIVGHYDSMVPPGDYDLVVTDSNTGEMGSVPVTLYDPAITQQAHYIRRSDGAQLDSWSAEVPASVEIEVDTGLTPRRSPLGYYFYWNDGAPHNAEPAGADPAWGGYDDRFDSGGGAQQAHHYYQRPGTFQPVLYIHYSDDSWVNVPIGPITLTAPPPPPPTTLTPPWYDTLDGKANLTTTRLAFAQSPRARNG